MNFPKGIQGTLRLHVFIQVVVSALVRTVLSSVSGQAHGAILTLHTRNTKDKNIL